MSIWNKILLAFILIGLLALSFFALRALKVHVSWRSNVNKLNESIDTQEKLADKLLNGDELGGQVTEKGIRQVSLDLRELQYKRGQIWTGCEPGRVQVQPSVQIGPKETRGPTPQVTVQVDGPDPYIIPTDEDEAPVSTDDTTAQPAAPKDHGLKVGDAIYVFEDIVDGEPGKYLGLFKVSSTAANSVVLLGNYVMTDEEINTLTQSASSGKSWTLRDTLPQNNVTLNDFINNAKLTEAEIQGILSRLESESENVDEGEGQALYQSLLDQASAEGSQKIADFEVLLAENNRRRIALQEKIESLTFNLEAMNHANELSSEQEEYRRNEIAQLKQEITVETDKLNDVKAHRDAVQKKIDELTVAIAETRLHNKKLAADIEQAQMQAIEAVESESATIAN